jgi:hypothetical protein
MNVESLYGRGCVAGPGVPSSFRSLRQPVGLIDKYQLDGSADLTAKIIQL